MGTVTRIAAIADSIATIKNRGDRLVIVVSAMSGETDRLIALAHQRISQPEHRELASLLATGEQASAALLAIHLTAIGCAAQSFTGWQTIIHTDSSYTKARITHIDTKPILTALQSGKVVIVTGFQGVSDHGAVTTLGRGGSDTTAVALAAALHAKECRIYTDVDGVYTADPKIVPEATRLDRITYEEMLEMSSLGSKVLQIRSVEFASKYNVKIRVLSSFVKGEGTVIEDNSENALMEEALISGIAHNRDEAKITVLGVPDKPGIASAILEPIAEANIEVDMIVQNVGVNDSTDFTFTVHRRDYHHVCDILHKQQKSLGARAVLGDETVVKISVVGAGMRSHAGIARKMFSALASEDINIMMISTSEIKISVVVAEKYLEPAVRALHSAFQLDKLREKNTHLEGRPSPIKIKSHQKTRKRREEK